MVGLQYEDVDNSTKVTVSGLQPGQEYLITTRAANTQGSSDYVTPPLTFTTPGQSCEIYGQTTFIPTTYHWCIQF